MSTSIKKFKENCEIINLVDSSILHKEFREFRDNIEFDFEKFRKFNPKPPDYLSVSFGDGPLTFENVYVLLSVHLGEVKGEFKMVIYFKSAQTTQHSKLISPLESSLLSSWDKKLQGYVIDWQIELLSDLIKRGFKDLIEKIDYLIDPLIKKRLFDLEQKNERLQSEIEVLSGRLSDLNKSMGYRGSSYAKLKKENESLGILFSSETRTAIEKFRDKFDIELHVDQITFPKREETYNERHLGQGRIYKTTSSVRNYSYSNYLSIYQGELILITEVYDYYESGPCDTPGSVFSRNICHVHNGQCFKETFLDSEIITSLPKISLKDIK